MYFFPCLLFSLISNVKQTTPLPLNSSSTNKTNKKSQNNRKLCARPNVCNPASRRNMGLQHGVHRQPITCVSVLCCICVCVFTCVFVYLNHYIHKLINRKHQNTHTHYQTRCTTITTASMWLSPNNTQLSLEQQLQQHKPQQ